jgi:hypothetical protein
MKTRRARKETVLENDEGVISPAVDLEPNSLITTSHQHPKHGRSDSDADAEVSAPNICQPPAKRTKKSSPVTKNADNAASRSRSRYIPPRSPLPQRINRVINPGAPDQKRAQRTSEEVAAAAKQKEKLALDLKRAKKEKIRMVAEIEAAEEEEERSEERTAIRDVTDLAESKTNDEDDGPEGPAKTVCSTLIQKDSGSFYSIRGGKLLAPRGMFVQQLRGRKRKLGRKKA